ncbi:MAG: amidohydrolase [Chloroflexi bacterium]|nr:amidohydrolase [Chloroflexota bacterium]
MLAVGALAEVGALLPDAQRVDLQGRTLIPGFNDAHVHIQWLGLKLTLMIDATIPNAPSIPALVELYRQRARTTAPGQWITGTGYNENFLPEKRHVTRYDLDEASREHPMTVTHTSGHVVVANSTALALAGIDRDTPDPDGGHIVRDEAGEPTGVLEETAMELVFQHIPLVTKEAMADAIRAAMAHQLSLGITSATDPAVTPFHIEVYRELDDAGELTMRINLLAERRSGDVIFPLPEKRVSDWLRLDSVKFFADGGMTSATAAISIPYKETGTHGIMIYETEQMAELMWEAHEAGFRIATHANGDLALEQVIGIYEAVLARKPEPALRHRIEHLALPTPEHLRRLAKIHAMAATQTVFLPAFGAAFRRYMPDVYVPGAYGVRDMIDYGVAVALSTDAPVVPDDNPLIGLKSAVDRLDHAGEPFGANQAITPYEALYAYTMGGAILSGDEDNRGSITPGKWADLTVLSGDPLTTPTGRLLDLFVEETYVGGRCAYQRKA